MRFIAAITAVAIAGPALGCGVCIEDKIAATYDHAVVSRATAQRHVVVFAAVEGAGTPRAMATEARRAALAVGSVDQGSVRVSHEPAPALSFAVDPATQTPNAALTAIERRARGGGLKLSLLRVIE